MYTTEVRELVLLCNASQANLWLRLCHYTRASLPCSSMQSIYVTRFARRKRFDSYTIKIQRGVEEGGGGSKRDQGNGFPSKVNSLFHSEQPVTSSSLFLYPSLSLSFSLSYSRPSCLSSPLLQQGFSSFFTVLFLFFTVRAGTRSNAVALTGVDIYRFSKWLRLSLSMCEVDFGNWISALPVNT